MRSLWGGALNFCKYPIPYQTFNVCTYICAYTCMCNTYIYTWGDPKTPKFIYKKLCIYSHMFKLQSPSKYSPSDAMHLSRHCFHCSEQFLNSSFWMSYAVSAIFVSPLPYGQNISLWGLFQLEERKRKVTLGEIEWIERVGHVGLAVFGQKLMNTQHSVTRCACKSPIMRCANVLKESSEKCTKGERSLSQWLQLTHWCRWVPRTLT